MNASTRNACFLALSIAVFATSAACGNSEPSEPADGFDRQALLAGVADDLIVPAYRQFVAQAEALRDRTADWAAVADPSSPAAGAARTAAQEAWRAAMRAWQRAELMQVGPAGRAPDILAGRALRDEIYSWNSVSACRVDQELVNNAFGEPDFFTNRLVNVTGLDALEYLMFYAGEENACAQSVPINDEGTWAAALSDIPARRAAYAAAAAEDVVANGRTILDAWEGGFRDQFVNPDTAGSPYASRQAAIDQLFAAVFYLESQVKDAKLATPAGISQDCASSSCPEDVESPWAEVSLSNIRENLESARLLLLGGSDAATAVGFDDFLVNLNAEDTAGRLRLALDEANTAMASMEGDSLRTIVETDLQSARALHDDVKNLTDILKSEFVTVLNLRVPQEGAADND